MPLRPPSAPALVPVPVPVPVPAWALGFAVVVLAAACAPDAKPAPRPLVPLPALGHAPTVRERVLAPTHDKAHGGDNPALPANVQRYLDDAVGALADAPGEAPAVRTVDGAPAPARGPHPRRLVRFVHLADIQLMDDESPTRAADFDSPAVAAAIRPHDPLVCRMLNAAVRTINALHAEDPVDFVLLGGDNSDSAQENEVRWVMQILDGSPSVHCDSGADDDIDPAVHNDGKDAFAAAGLDMPWRWVSGNHDVTVQGAFAIVDEQRTAVLGTDAQFGTRVYDGPGLGYVADGDVALADASRRLLDGPALLDLVGADGDGHGLKSVERARGKAFYSFEVPGTPLTFMILDSTHAKGGGEGVLQLADVEHFVKPVLDDAEARGRVVVLASHHAVGSLTVDGGVLGHTESDALLPADWLAWLAQYPSVLFSMVGHAHKNQIGVEQTASHAFWEVMTSSLADWPHQFRVVEIWDDDNGTLRLETAPVDYLADDDAPAALGRTLGLIDYLSGWNDWDGRGAPADRCATLIVPRPPSP